jgi:DNA-binding CsgD family transcriptional regulator
LITERETAAQNLENDQKSAKEILRRFHLSEKRVKITEESLKRLELNNEILLQRLEIVQKERDSIKDGFTQGMLALQKKSGMAQLVLEMKLQEMQMLQKNAKNNG